MKIFICKNKCFFLILCKNITGLGTGISGAVQNEQSIQQLCSCTFVVYTNGNAQKIYNWLTMPLLKQLMLQFNKVVDLEGRSPFFNFVKCEFQTFGILSLLEWS